MSKKCQHVIVNIKTDSTPRGIKNFFHQHLYVWQAFKNCFSALEIGLCADYQTTTVFNRLEATCIQLTGTKVRQLIIT